MWAMLPGFVCFFWNGDSHDWKFICVCVNTPECANITLNQVQIMPYYLVLIGCG